MRDRVPNEHIKLLGKVPLFSGCSTGDLRTVARFGTTVDAQEGRVFTKTGEPGFEFFLVLEGIASCREEGREVKRFETGGYFGELALLSGGVRTADVVAITPMKLLVFNSREFQSMLATTPSIGVKMLSNLAERLTTADAQYSN
jgi:CRP-like cAMP-binding protein